MTNRRKSVAGKGRKQPLDSAVDPPEIQALQKECLEKLEETRRQIADFNFIKNPEFVFTSLTLEQMSLKMPTTEEDMMNIDGVTLMKYSQFGEDFMAVRIKSSFHVHLLVKKRQEITPSSLQACFMIARSSEVY